MEQRRQIWLELYIIVRLLWSKSLPIYDTMLMLKRYVNNTNILPRCRKDREMKNDVRVWWNVDRKESEEEKEELFSKENKFIKAK